MAPEINWTRSLKNKLHIWRGSKRRPKSVKKIPVLSPTEYRQRWPFVRVATKLLRECDFALDAQHQTRLAEYADAIESSFGESVRDDVMPDPMLDALVGLLVEDRSPAELTRLWFGGGAAYVIDIIDCWEDAHSLLYGGAARKYLDVLESRELALLAKFRRQFIAFDANTYNDALAYADVVFSGKESTRETRAHLAYLFPEKTTWGNTIIAELPRLIDKSYGFRPPKHARAHAHLLMFASGADFEHLEKLIDLCCPRRLDRSGTLCWWREHIEGALDSVYALLDRFEEDARRLLISFLDLPWYGRPAPVVEALCHIPHQEVFDELATRFVGVNVVLAEVREHFISYPDMGLAALTPLVKQGEELGEGLGEIYEELRLRQTRLAAETEGALSLATRDDFTGVLAAPPWHDEEKAASRMTFDKVMERLDDTVSWRGPAEVDGSNKLENLESWVRDVTSKKDVLDACALVSWSGLAPKVAELLGTKTMRDGALEWVEANPRDAAIGGIPAYLGTRGAKKRKHLSELLRSARQADEEVFDEVVDAYAEKHGEELRDFLPDFEDTTAAYPKKMPELPAFWNPAAYPPILLEKDLSKRIPTDICDDIALMLAFSPPGKPYVGLLELKAQADATSLGEFTWALFQSWIKAGCPLDEEWVIQGLALFGGPEVAKGLSYLLDTWLRYSSRRSEKVIEAIAPGCNEYTLEALWRYLHGGHAHRALDLTRKKLEEVFDVGVGDELCSPLDRAAPTFGIGKDHRIKLKGASGKGLKVWLDKDLEPHLSGSDTGLDELDEPMRLRWERLGRLCAWQARFQSRRFERAMRTQRAWSIEDWQNDILNHPLLGMLAHKLLWGVYMEDELVGAFRVDGENAPMSIEDDPFELGAFTDHTVRLVHPLHIVRADNVAWGQIFSEYEIIQPFKQLDRKIWRADEAQTLIRGVLASFSSTLGELQRMFEEHDWSSPSYRRPSYSISKVSRSIRFGSPAALVKVNVKVNMVEHEGYFPGGRTDDARDVLLEVKLGVKDTDFNDFCPIDLSELVWELERARSDIER